MTDTQMFSLYSDTFKDAYGYRPQGATAESFLEASMEVRENILETFQAKVVEVIERERRETEFAWEDFTKHLDSIIQDTDASSRVDALRYVMQAENVDSNEYLDDEGQLVTGWYSQEVEHVFWSYDVLFHPEAKSLIKDFVDSMK